MNKMSVRDVDLKDKKVIMRVDYNVPLDEQGDITDDARIRASLETIRYILNEGAKKLILMSHLGRPKGKVVETLRLREVGKRLESLVGEAVDKLDDCKPEVVAPIIAQSSKRIILLENLRFSPQEEAGDEEFAQGLASLADVYVNDAFGTAHRRHASTTVIAQFIPSCIGFLMEKEIKHLQQALYPQKPYAVILGGAKVSDKIGVLKNIMNKVDKMLIGGAFCYTFLKSKGEPVGSSRVEEEKKDLAKEIFEEAERKGVEIILPIDHLVVKDIKDPSSREIVESIPSGYIGVDIGPRTVNLFKEELQTAKTILWNGPLGIFENPAYAEGTKEIAHYLGSLEEVTVIVGGGDSALAAKEFGVVDKLTHVSTGGGASLEFLEGKELPGIAVIPNKEKVSLEG